MIIEVKLRKGHDGQPVVFLSVFSIACSLEIFRSLTDYMQTYHDENHCTLVEKASDHVSCPPPGTPCFESSPERKSLLFLKKIISLIREHYFNVTT